jgi:hypothetical protein
MRTSVLQLDVVNFSDGALHVQDQRLDVRGRAAP